VDSGRLLYTGTACGSQAQKRSGHICGHTLCMVLSLRRLTQMNICLQIILASRGALHLIWGSNHPSTQLAPISGIVWSRVRKPRNNKSISFQLPVRSRQQDLMALRSPYRIELDDKGTANVSRLESTCRQGQRTDFE
jgi:hypothetical protein